MQVISAEVGYEMMKTSKEPFVLLDVRHAAEYERGFIPGAVLLDNDDILREENLDVLPEDKKTTLIVYCRSGRRSNVAARKLEALGYESVFDMGGILDWHYEIER